MSLSVPGTGSADVVGDGPAALMTAIVLARRGWKIRLATSPRRRPRQCRIDVLGGSALPSLMRLGISFDEIHDIARPCPGSWSRWDTADAQSHDYLTQPYGSAWAIDRGGLEALLWKHAAKAGIAVAHDQKHPALSSSRVGLGTADCDDGKWRILALGAVNRQPVPQSPTVYSDRLIAIVTYGRLEHDADPVDARLLIEAASDGWAYGIVGPNNHVCLGVITDAESLAGETPRTIALRVLGGTARIGCLATKLSGSISFYAIPVPCRWLPLKIDPSSVRLGDAQASFDPVAGRGLWSALRIAEEIAITLDTRPDQLTRLEERSWASYQHYLAERTSLYRAARNRFGTGFWVRRCASHARSVPRTRIDFDGTTAPASSLLAAVAVQTPQH